MPLIILDAPFEPFEYESDNSEELILGWSIDNDAITNAFSNNGITHFGLLLNQLDFTVQLDSSKDFNTVNLKQYNKINANKFNIGRNIFSVQIPKPKNSYNNDLSFFWRVKHELSSVSMSTLSDYCTYSEFSILKEETIEIADEMHNNLPDSNVYTKDEKSTNIYTLLKNYGKQIRESKIENTESKNILFLDKVRESDIQKSFGRLLDFSKPSTMSSPEYRGMLKKLFNLYSKSGTVYSIKEIVKLLTGTYPEVLEYKNKYGWIVYDERRDPTISPFPYPPEPFKYDNPYAHFFPINDLDPYTGFLLPKCAPMSNFEKVFSLEIRVRNPFLLDLNRDLIAAAIYKFKPAHVKVYLYIENSLGQLEIYSYWDYAYSGTYYFSSEGE